MNEFLDGLKLIGIGISGFAAVRTLVDSFGSVSTGEIGMFRNRITGNVRVPTDPRGKVETHTASVRPILVIQHLDENGKEIGEPQYRSPDEFSHPGKAMRELSKLEREGKLHIARAEQPIVVRTYDPAPKQGLLTKIPFLEEFVVLSQEQTTVDPDELDLQVPITVNGVRTIAGADFTMAFRPRVPGAEEMWQRFPYDDALRREKPEVKGASIYGKWRRAVVNLARTAALGGVSGGELNDMTTPEGKIRVDNVALGDFSAKLRQRGIGGMTDIQDFTYQGSDLGDLAGEIREAASLATQRIVLGDDLFREGMVPQMLQKTPGAIFVLPRGGTGKDVLEAGMAKLVSDSVKEK